jgi:hypothetical protein
VSDRAVWRLAYRLIRLIGHQVIRARAMDPIRLSLELNEVSSVSAPRASKAASGAIAFLCVTLASRSLVGEIPVVIKSLRYFSAGAVK